MVPALNKMGELLQNTNHPIFEQVGHETRRTATSVHEAAKRGTYKPWGKVCEC